MKAKVLKDSTLTVKAGQIVEVDPKQFTIAEKLGYVQIVEEKPKKKGKKKKPESEEVEGQMQIDDFV